MRANVIKKKKIICFSLLVIELLIVLLAIISFNNKGFVKRIFDTKNDLNMFKVLKEIHEGEYASSTTLPTTGYVYNSDKSGCIDKNGETIPNSLVYNAYTGAANVSVGKTAQCYLYFDKIVSSFNDKLITENYMWNSPLLDDGYRATSSGLCTYTDEGGTFEGGTSSNGICPTLYRVDTYNHRTSDFMSTDYFQETCPENYALFDYECFEEDYTISNFSDPDNYACFGTENKTTCINNPSIYMYRVLGLFYGNDGKLHVKLIKKDGFKKSWSDESYEIEKSWSQSTLYLGINGDFFLTNTTYPYMQDSEWTNRITNWTWSAVNTLGSSANRGVNYWSVSTDKMYLHELNKTRPATYYGLCPSASSSCDFTKGVWDTPTAKIGIMYAHDYQLSTGNPSLNFKGYADYATMVQSWIFVEQEWLMAREGLVLGSYYPYYIKSDGSITIGFSQGGRLLVRPTFYLNNNITYTGGTGSITDPYMISSF